MTDELLFQPPIPSYVDLIKVPDAVALSSQDSMELLAIKKSEYHEVIGVKSDSTVLEKALALGSVVRVNDDGSDLTAPSSARTSRTNSIVLSRSSYPKEHAGYLPSHLALHACPITSISHTAASLSSMRSTEIHTNKYSDQVQDIDPPIHDPPIHPLSSYVPSGCYVEPDAKSSRSVSPESLAVATVNPVFDSLPGDEGQKVLSNKRLWKFGLKKQAAIDKKVAVPVPADGTSSLVLPSAPSDNEKVLYAQTRRIPLYFFGTISFLSISAGMWLFTIANKGFYWWVRYLLWVYLLIFFVIGYVGKDFDLKEHDRLLKEDAFPVEKLPLVDIYLPCCHEPLEILENTYKHVQKLQYPNFKVWVLDDGGLDSVKRLAESYGFNYITRDNKPHLKKAGNLRYAFMCTEGDFFAIFDADFCPRHDFLDNILPYMNKYKDIAIVQSPQFFRPCSEQTWTEQGASATQELFYRVVQVNRDRWGGAICVGSNAVYRREALIEVGGTAEIGHSEDVHTGFYAVTRGWRVKYIPLALACGMSPDTPKAYFSQQMRWCSGSTSLLINANFWKSNLSIIQKVCYLSGMMFYASSAAMVVLNTLPGLLLLAFHPGVVLWYNCAFVIPSLIYSVFIFRLWSRQKYNFNCNFVFVIQQYAYLMAIKDRIFNTTALWVPSGDAKAHGSEKKKGGMNNKYRNMRIFCAAWLLSSASGMIIGTVFRVRQGFHWYNFLPLLLLDAFSLFIAHKFILFSK